MDVIVARLARRFARRLAGRARVAGGLLAACAAALAPAGAQPGAPQPLAPGAEPGVYLETPQVPRQFALPIRCSPGRDCFVQNYFDRDAGAGRRDYACGSLSYDGHHGTDFRVRSLAHMVAGVEVVAAAEGTVAGTRDGEPDVSLRERGASNLQGRDAGNAVRIDHGDGWQTQYSHMMRGSVRVRPGQRVEAGTVLGLVGLSGRTEFPHLDFVVRYRGRALDPFDPTPSSGRDAATCPDGPGAASLWRDELRATLRYQTSGVLITGFAGERVDRGKAQRGEYASLVAADAPVLLFFAEAFGARRGDREVIELVGPGDRVIARSVREVDRDQALRFATSGRASDGGRWPAGVYRGRYALERDGRVAVQATGELRIE